MTGERNLDLLPELLRDIQILSFEYVTGKCHCGGKEVLLIVARRVSGGGFKWQQLQKMLLGWLGEGKKSLYEGRLEDIDLSNTAKLRSRGNKHQEEMRNVKKVICGKELKGW